MRKFILSLSLAPILIAGTAHADERKAFACVSISGAQGWYITGKWAAPTIELNQDGLPSTYQLKKVLEKGPEKESYSYQDLELAGNRITIGHLRQEIFRARLFTKDSQDVFDNVTFDCKFSRN